MSQYENELDDEFTDESEALRSLRSAYKKQKKELAEAQEQLVTLSQEKRKTTIAGTLKSLGVNPKIATFVPSDVEPDGVRDWITEFGDIFGLKDQGEEEKKPEASFYTEDEVAQLERIDGVAANSAKPGSPQNIADQITGATNEADLLALLRQTPTR